MSLLDIGNKITPATLRKHKFSKGSWGPPDGWIESESRYSRPKAVWNPEHMMWENVEENHCIFYFPDIFKGYVNINRNDIKNHAGWMLGSCRWDNATSGWIAYKVEDEADFEVALHTILKQLEEEE